jgi:hypothetical protein
MMNQNMEQAGFSLTPTHVVRLNKLWRMTRISKSALVREALDDLFLKYKDELAKEEPSQWMQEY